MSGTEPAAQQPAEQPSTQQTDPQAPPEGQVYDLCLLVERPLSHVDAQQVVALHRDWAWPVHYHVLIPMVESAATLESSLATLGTGEVLSAAPLAMLSEEAERARADAIEASVGQCGTCVQVLTDAGVSADCEVVVGDPVERLVAAVAERGSAEVIILTRAHLMAELFHTDWTHQARKRLGVPLLHLLEHRDH
jgi:hypothetical protein